jgi:hypothetical protein
MRFLHRVLSVAALVVAVLLSGEAFATAKKVPLTLMHFGKVHYLEWTGSASSAPINASDTLSFYADTSGTPTANDPLKLLQAEYSQDWKNARFPGNRFPEKLCGNIVSRAEADSTTAVLGMQYASSTTATRYYEGTSATAIFPGTTSQGNLFANAFVPNKFFVPKLSISTATDSLYPLRATFWLCDD